MLSYNSLKNTYLNTQFVNYTAVINNEQSFTLLMTSDDCLKCEPLDQEKQTILESQNMKIVKILVYLKK